MVVLSRIVWFVIASSLPLVVGCQEAAPERVVVTGEVTYNGKPVREGELRFFPTAATKAPMSGAIIRDGRFTANALGGVPVGTFRVEITGYRNSRDSQIVDLEQQTDGGQYLPAKYNTKTELEMEVPPSRGSISKDFHLGKS